MNDFTSDNDIFWSGQWEDSSDEVVGWDDITTSDNEIKEIQYEEIETAGEYEEIARSIKSITDLLEKIEKNTSDGEKSGSEIGDRSDSRSEGEAGSAEESTSEDGSVGRNQLGEQRETEGETESTTDEYQQLINAGLNDIKIELQNTQKLMEQQILNDRLYAEVGIGVLSIIAGMIIVQIAVGRLR